MRNLMTSKTEIQIKLEEAAEYNLQLEEKVYTAKKDNLDLEAQNKAI
jgi:hypothetical protein